MKRKFDICIFLCAAFSVSAICHLFAYQTLRDGINLTNFIISAFAVVFFGALKLVTLSNVTYTVTDSDVFYKFGDNVFLNSTFVKSHNILDKQLLALSTKETQDRFLFENAVAKFPFDVVTTNSGCKILIIDKFKIRKKHCSRSKKIELEISDHKKNFDFIDQKLGVIPIENLPDSVTVERSKNKRFFVAIRKTSNALLLSCYRLVFINTFSKVQEISFDFLYWLHDYQEGEESFANEQSAIARSKELICEYDKTHDEKGNLIQ